MESELERYWTRCTAPSPRVAVATCAVLALPVVFVDHHRAEVLDQHGPARM